jgi:hypothetical protein
VLDHPLVAFDVLVGEVDGAGLLADRGFHCFNVQGKGVVV